MRVGRVVAVFDLVDAAGDAVVAADDVSVAGGFAHHDGDGEAPVDADLIGGGVDCR